MTTPDKDAQIWADTEPDVDDLTRLADAAAECDARRAEVDAEAEPEPEPEASDLGRFEPTPYDLGITDDPEVTRAEVREPYGPQFPGLRDLYRAQDAPLEADRAGSGEAEYQSLVLERQQTELAFLAGCDRRLENDLEARAEPEAEWDSADSNAYQARLEADTGPSWVYYATRDGIVAPADLPAEPTAYYMCLTGDPVAGAIPAAEWERNAELAREAAEADAAAAELEAEL